MSGKKKKAKGPRKLGKTKRIRRILSAKEGLSEPVLTNTGKRIGQPCKICIHQDVIQINEDLQGMFTSGDTIKEISRRYKVSYDSLYRHAYNHIQLDVERKKYPSTICRQRINGQPPTAADLIYALRQACTPDKLMKLMEVALEQAIKNPVAWNIQSITGLLKIAVPTMKAVEVSHQSGKDDSAKILKAIERVTGKNPELIAKIVQELQGADGPSSQ